MQWDAFGANNRTFAVSLYPRALLAPLVHAAYKPHQQTPVPAPPTLHEFAPLASAVPRLGSRKLATRDFEMDHVGQTYPCRDFESALDYKTRN